MQFKEVNQKINDYQKKADEMGVDVNVVMMYQAFYEQHKIKHGSYKRYIQTDKYLSKMNERDDDIFQSIDDVINAKSNIDEVKEWEKYIETLK